MTTFKPTIDWTGDRRKMVQPPAEAPGAHPRKVRIGTACFIARNLLKARHSFHSPMGSTLWVVLDFCLSHRIAFNLTTHYDDKANVAGYSVSLD